MPFKTDLTGVKESGGVNVAPAGVYLLRVGDTEERESRNGDPQVGMKLYIESGISKGVWMFHSITFLPSESKGAGFGKHFLKLVNQKHEGSVTVDPSLWNGKVFKGRIEIVNNEKNGQLFKNNRLTNDSWTKDDENAPELGLSEVEAPKVMASAGPVVEEEIAEVPF